MKNYSIRNYLTVMYAVSFIIVAAVLITTVNMQQRKRGLAEAEEKARILLDHNMAIHTYFSNELKPKVFELVDLHHNKGYFEPTWMSSTYAIRKIDNYYKVFSQNNYYYKESAVNARSASNEADPFEKSFIEELRRNRSLTSRSLIRDISGIPYFVILRRGESMEKGCLKCHSRAEAAPADLVKRYGPNRSFNRSEGELVSAVSIRIPLNEAYAAANEFSLKLSMILLLILGLSYSFQYVALNATFFRPIIAMRRRVLDIIGDEAKLGLEMPLESHSTEIRDLTNSFNQLSRNLRCEKDRLVDQVEVRTSELTEKVAQLEAAVTRVKMLEEILPICSYCKKIRNDKEQWQQLERYFSEHSGTSFTHGVCPECYEKEMSKLRELIPPRKG